MGDRIQQAVWNWRAAAEAPARLSPGTVIFRSIWVLLVAAFLLAWGHTLAGFIVGGLGLLTLLLGFAAPAAWLKLADLGNRFAAGVGRILGWVLLTPMFCLVIIPGGLVLRATGRDPLHRRFRAEGLSYWIRRRSSPQASQYSRQFLVEDPQARAEVRPMVTGDLDDGSPQGSLS